MAFSFQLIDGQPFTASEIQFSGAMAPDYSGAPGPTRVAAGPNRLPRLGGDAEARALDGLGDRRHVRPLGQAHLAALEIDRDWRGSGARGGTGDGLYAAVAIHAGDLEDEFLSHVI